MYYNYDTIVLKKSSDLTQKITEVQNFEKKSNVRQIFVCRIVCHGTRGDGVFPLALLNEADFMGGYAVVLH